MNDFKIITSHHCRHRFPFHVHKLLSTQTHTIDHTPVTIRAEVFFSRDIIASFCLSSMHRLSTTVGRWWNGAEMWCSVEFILRCFSWLWSVGKTKQRSTHNESENNADRQDRYFGGLFFFRWQKICEMLRKLVCVRLLHPFNMHVSISE